MSWSLKENESGKARPQSPRKKPKYVGKDEFEIEVLRRLTAQQNSLDRLQWRVLLLAVCFLSAALAVLLFA